MKKQRIFVMFMALMLFMLHTTYLPVSDALALSLPGNVIPQVPIATPKPDDKFVITLPPNVKFTPRITLKPMVTPTPTTKIIIPTVKIPVRPTATPKLVSTPKPTPQITKKPTNVTPKLKTPVGSGQLMTSEGPLFLSFRTDLTDKYWMFTPIDLSLDGQFQYPLVADASHVVGELKVEVAGGMVVVSYMLVNGVSVDREHEFFTFFTDIASVTTVDPARLQDVKMLFNIPYHVTSRLNSDPNVLLYVNTPLSYDTGLPGLRGFSFQDEGYLRRLTELYPLMD